jgi:hypothetical protein
MRLKPQWDVQHPSKSTAVPAAPLPAAAAAASFEDVMPLKAQGK